MPSQLQEQRGRDEGCNKNRKDGTRENNSGCAGANDGDGELRRRVEELEKKVETLVKENEQFKKQIRALLTTIQQMSKK